MSQNFLGGAPEGPDVKRLLLAGLLMTGVLMMYNVLFPPAATPVAAKKEIAQKEVVKQDVLVPTVVAPYAKATPSNTPIVTREFVVNVKESGEEAALAARGGYQATVTSLGAQLSAFVLTGYETPINLVSDLAQHHMFALRSRDNQVTLAATAHYELLSSDASSAVFQYVTPEGIRVVRKYAFASNQFVMNQEIEIHNDGVAKRQVSLDLLLDKTDKDSKDDQMGVVWLANAEHERLAFDKLEKEKKSVEGTLNYIGIDTRYFLMALIPQDQKSVTKSSVMVNPAKAVSWVLQQKPVILEPGASHKWAYSAYMGPKQVGLLKQAGHQLDENIDFGWFGALSRPMLWLLSQIFVWVGNFGLAIILLTLLIKLLTFPLTQKSFVSMQQMKTLAPDMAALKKKYSHDKTMLGQKQMELYKEKGINPMAGCLPMLIQMPVWFALYQMLWNSIELYQQPFAFWIHDLTRPDQYYVLPALMGISMLIQQAFQPTMEDNPQMKYVMWFMPLFLTFVMLSMPSGLSLYIFTNNILTILQQLYIRRRYGT